MKRLLLLFVLTTVFPPLMAQQLRFRPVDSLSSSINKVIKSQTDSWNKSKFDININAVLAADYNSIYNLDVYNEYFHNNLPVLTFDEATFMPIKACYCYVYVPDKRLAPFNAYFIKRKEIQDSPIFKSTVVPLLVREK